MTASPISCILYTRDGDLSRQVASYLQGQARVLHCEDARRLETQLGHAANALVLLDLRAERAVHHLRHLARHREDLVVVTLGISGSTPMVEAESLGVFAAVGLPLARPGFQAIIKRAAGRLALQLQIESLKEQVSGAAPGAAGAAAAAPPAAPRISLLARGFRHTTNVRALLESIVDSVAAAIRVSRVGVFARLREDDRYRLGAGLRCLEESLGTTYAPEDPLIRWLEVNACQIARSHLGHVGDFPDRIMLKQELDILGAEVILPLLGRHRLLGFLLVGNRATGVPFAYDDYEHLLEVAEQVAATLENAMLYEELAVQKTLAETLLHSLPTGTVSIGTDETVKSINQAAETYLQRGREEVVGQPVSVLGGQLGSLLLRALRANETTPRTEWTDPRTKKILVVEARRLMHDADCLGAVAIIHDVSDQRRIQQKKEQLERATFWADLAASMSHEVRNPLVAIKTFAQLLPERYEEADFRNEFSTLVSAEVDRLNRIIEQISDFANPPQLRLTPLDLAEVAQQSIAAVLQQEQHSGIRIATDIQPGLPPVAGDAKALAECVGALLINAMEATFDQGKPAIEVTVRAGRDADGNEQVVLTLSDNGPGIPEAFRDKVFSPFCTSKPRGMGLGLPIAKRTVIDHNGTIDIDTGAAGTRVILTFPACRTEVLA